MNNTTTNFLFPSGMLDIVENTVSETINNLKTKFNLQKVGSLTSKIEGEFIELNMIIPGVPVEKISLTAQDGFIIICVNKLDTTKFDYEGVNERYQIPNGVDVSSIKATHKDGVLTITIPKKRDHRVVVIPIE